MGNDCPTSSIQQYDVILVIIYWRSIYIVWHTERHLYILLLLWLVSLWPRVRNVNRLIFSISAKMFISCISYGFVRYIKSEEWRCSFYVIMKLFRSSFNRYSSENDCITAHPSRLCGCLYAWALSEIRGIFISLVTSYVRLREEELQTAFPMFLT